MDYQEKFQQLQSRYVSREGLLDHQILVIMFSSAQFSRIIALVRRPLGVWVIGTENTEAVFWEDQDQLERVWKSLGWLALPEGTIPPVMQVLDTVAYEERPPMVHGQALGSQLPPLTVDVDGFLVSVEDMEQTLKDHLPLLEECTSILDACEQQAQPAKPIEHRGTFRFTILHDVPMRDFDDAPWTLLAGTVCTGDYYEEQVDGSLYIRPREHVDMTLDPSDVRIEQLSEER